MATVKVTRRCERCGHQLYGWPGDWRHWDVDDAYDDCPCTEEDRECIPDDSGISGALS